jgi:hypothetical protein
MSLSRRATEPLARSDEVKLRGIWQLERAARVERIDSRAAHLEVWVPVTAPGWTGDQPVTWIIRDGSLGHGTAGLATRSGTMLKEGLPPEARSALARQRVVLAPTVRLLDVPMPEDLLNEPAFVVLLALGALAVGALLAAALLGVKARRRAAILKGAP